MTQSSQGSITELQLSKLDRGLLLNTALSVKANAALVHSNLSFRSGVYFTPMLKRSSYLCNDVTAAPPSEPVKQSIQSLKHYSTLADTYISATSPLPHSTPRYIVKAFHDYMVQM